MLAVPKKQLYLVLPLMGKSLDLLDHYINLFIKFFVFKTSNRQKNYFSFKDVVPEPLRFCQIYNFTCGSCNVSYIGKALRHMKFRVSEHQGVSLGTGKHLKETLSTSVRDHILIATKQQPGMTLKYWEGSLIIDFWRLRRVYLLKEIDLRSLRIFTPRNCFYFSFTMSVMKLLLLDTLFVNLADC